MKNAIVLCSGGVDSVVSAFYAKKKLKYGDIIILFFNYGQRSLKAERKCARQCAKDLKANFLEINIKWLGKISTSLINLNEKHKIIKKKDLKDTKEESKKWYVPCRNLIFLSYALAFAESLFIKNKIISDIFVGFKNEGKEHYPDTSQKFLNLLNKINNVATLGKYKINAPLIKKDKDDIILLGNKLGVNFTKTFSCYIGKKKHCGTCLACRLRQEGFYWENIKDPTSYRKKMKDFRLAP